MARSTRRSRTGTEPHLGAWLINDTRVLASANLARTRRERRRGMKDFPDASLPLVITPCNWVHSFGMKFPVDVVYLDANDAIIDIALLKPGRIALPRRHAVRVIETQPNACRLWGIAPGDTIRVREAEFPPATESPR